MAVAGICDLPGSPRFSYSANGGITAVRTVLCPWPSWRDYATELAPATVVIGTIVTQKPGAQLPHLTLLRVTGFDWEPFWGQQDRISEEETDLTNETDPYGYKYAKFTINYAIPTAPQSEDDAEGVDPVPFLEHRITSGGQLLALDQSDSEDKWKWQRFDDPVPEDLPINIMVSTSQHDVHWPRVIQPNWPNLEKFKGAVNHEPFTLRGYAYPAESLLYLNYDMQETVMTDGTQAYSLTLHFEGKVVSNVGRADSFAILQTGIGEYGGHNHFWHKSENYWERIYIANTESTIVDGQPATITTNVYPYPRADFNELFKAGS